MSCAIDARCGALGSPTEGPSIEAVGVGRAMRSTTTFAPSDFTPDGARPSCSSDRSQIP